MLVRRCRHPGVARSCPRRAERGRAGGSHRVERGDQLGFGIGIECGLCGPQLALKSFMFARQLFELRAVLADRRDDRLVLTLCLLRRDPSAFECHIVEMFRTKVRSAADRRRQVHGTHDHVEVGFEFEQLQALAVEVEQHTVHLDRAPSARVRSLWDCLDTVDQALTHVRGETPHHRDQRMEVDGEST